VVVHRTQAGALAKLREVRRQVGIYGDVPTNAPTLAVWLERWISTIAAKRVRPRTLDTYAHKVDLITEVAGKVRLDKLTPAHVRAIQDHITGTRQLSSTTALQAHAILSKALKDAQREGLVVRNVALLVDRPAKAVSDRGALTAEQARQLLRANADDPNVSRWAFALLYGVRQGEALGLRWSSMDFERASIDLSHQLQVLRWRHGCQPACGLTALRCPSRHLGIPAGFEVEVLTGATVLTRPKSKAGIRTLPLIPVMAQALQLRRAAPGSHGLVWTDGAGRPWNPGRDNLAWHAALERADLPQVPLHSARHTAATLLMELGIDVRVASAILGHSDVLTTHAYQHADRTMTTAALEQLGRMLTAG
jgi:integrase